LAQHTRTEFAKACKVGSGVCSRLKALVYTWPDLARPSAALGWCAQSHLGRGYTPDIGIQDFVSSRRVRTRPLGVAVHVCGGACAGFN